MDEKTIRSRRPATLTSLQTVLETNKKFSLSELFPLNTFVNATFVPIDDVNADVINDVGEELEKSSSANKNLELLVNSKSKDIIRKKEKRATVCLTRAIPEKDYLSRKNYDKFAPCFQLIVFGQENNKLYANIIINNDYMVDRNYIEITKNMGSPFNFVLKLSK